MDGTGALRDMFFDGRAYFFVVPELLFADGTHRLVLRGGGVAGIVQALGIGVVFSDAVDTTNPVVIPGAPVDRSAAQGIVII